MIHTLPLSFSTGNSFYSKKATLKDPKILLVFILFILGSPIGMIIGMVLKSQAGSLTDGHSGEVKEEK